MGQQSWASHPIAHSKGDGLGAALAQGYQAPYGTGQCGTPAYPDRAVVEPVIHPPALHHYGQSWWPQVELKWGMGGAEAGQDHSRL